MSPSFPAWMRWIRDPEQIRRIDVLSETPAFAGLPRRLLGRLAGRLFEKGYQPGDVVFHEGDPGKGLFVVLSGQIEVLRGASDGPERLALLGPGSAFGEMALIDDQPRAATARATEPSRLLILYSSHFDDLVEGDRGIALVMMRNLLRTLAGYVRGNLPTAGPPVSKNGQSGSP